MKSEVVSVSKKYDYVDGYEIESTITHYASGESITKYRVSKAEELAEQELFYIRTGKGEING